MKLIFKTFLSAVFIATLFFAQPAFAEKDPTFDTLSATSITDDIAFLHGEFNSRDNNYFPTSQPIVWFEYGRERNDLDRNTPETAKIKGNYVVTQGISDLRDDTKYYFRAVISFDGDTDYGDVVSFYTKEELEEKSILNNDQQNNNDFISPSSLLDSYFDGVSSDRNTSSGEFTNGGVIGESEPLSFLNLFSWSFWKRDKNPEPEKNNNLVTGEEEINRNISQQEDFKNSAQNDDELGEVIEYNTNYNNYGSGTASVRVGSGNGTLNYPVLLLIILILVLAVTFIYISLRRRRKRMNMSRGPIVRKPYFRANAPRQNYYSNPRNQHPNIQGQHTTKMQNPNDVVPGKHQTQQNLQKPE